VSRRRKVRVKCNPDDTIGDLKKLLAAQTGEGPSRGYDSVGSFAYAGERGSGVAGGGCNAKCERPRIDFARPAGTRAEKIRLQKWHTIYKDHISLEVSMEAQAARCDGASSASPLRRPPLAGQARVHAPCNLRPGSVSLLTQDYEVHDGFGFELFYH